MPIPTLAPRTAFGSVGHTRQKVSAWLATQIRGRPGSTTDGREGSHATRGRVVAFGTELDHWKVQQLADSFAYGVDKPREPSSGSAAGVVDVGNEQPSGPPPELDRKIDKKTRDRHFVQKSWSRELRRLLYVRANMGL